MHFEVIASSSKGNCYTIDDGRTKLMIDPGIPIKKIKEALNFQLSDIRACLASHVHADHIMAARDIMKAGIDVYASSETLEAAKLFGHRAHAIKAMHQIRIGTWLIKPFPLKHDVPCVGFLLNSCLTNEIAIYACDTQFVRHRFKGSAHILAIECNYDMDVLKQNVRSGTIDIGLAKKIIQNHMSLQTVLDFLKTNDMAKVQKIHLLHLSTRNADAALFKKEIQALCGRPVYIGG